MSTTDEYARVHPNPVPLSEIESCTDAVVFKKDSLVYAQYQNGDWYLARMMTGRTDKDGHLQIKMHYQGWNSRWDTFLNVERIRMCNEPEMELKEEEEQPFKVGHFVSARWRNRSFPAKISDIRILDNGEKWATVLFEDGFEKEILVDKLARASPAQMSKIKNEESFGETPFLMVEKTSSNDSPKMCTLLQTNSRSRRRTVNSFRDLLNPEGRFQKRRPPAKSPPIIVDGSFEPPVLRIGILPLDPEMEMAKNKQIDADFSVFRGPIQQNDGQTARTRCFYFDQDRMGVEKVEKRLNYEEINDEVTDSDDLIARFAANINIDTNLSARRSKRPRKQTVKAAESFEVLGRRKSSLKNYVEENPTESTDTVHSVKKTVLHEKETVGNPSKTIQPVEPGHSEYIFTDSDEEKPLSELTSKKSSIPPAISNDQELFQTTIQNKSPSLDSFSNRFIVQQLADEWAGDEADGEDMKVGNEEIVERVGTEPDNENMDGVDIGKIKEDQFGDLNAEFNESDDDQKRSDQVELMSEKEKELRGMENRVIEAIGMIHEDDESDSNTLISIRKKNNRKQSMRTLTTEEESDNKELTISINGRDELAILRPDGTESKEIITDESMKLGKMDRIVENAEALALEKALKPKNVAKKVTLEKTMQSENAGETLDIRRSGSAKANNAMIPEKSIEPEDLDEQKMPTKQGKTIKTQYSKTERERIMKKVNEVMFGREDFLMLEGNTIHCRSCRHFASDTGPTNRWAVGIPIGNVAAVVAHENTAPHRKKLADYYQQVLHMPLPEWHKYGRRAELTEIRCTHLNCQKTFRSMDLMGAHVRHIHQKLEPVQKTPPIAPKKAPLIKKMPTFDRAKSTGKRPKSHAIRRTGKRGRPKKRAVLLSSSSSSSSSSSTDMDREGTDEFQSEGNQDFLSSEGSRTISADEEDSESDEFEDRSDSNGIYSDTLGMDVELDETAEEANLHLLTDDDLIRCVCKLAIERGFMVQCDRCETWQHGNCVKIRKSGTPEHYLCYVCRDPPGLRTSRRHCESVLREYLQDGLLPSFGVTPTADEMCGPAPRPLRAPCMIKAKALKTRAVCLKDRLRAIKVLMRRGCGPTNLTNADPKVAENALKTEITKMQDDIEARLSELTSELTMAETMWYGKFSKIGQQETQIDKEMLSLVYDLEKVKKMTQLAR